MDALFLLKKIVTPFFMPLSFILILLVAGLAIIGAGRKKHRTGKALLLLGTALLLLAGYGFITDRLAASLENRYPPLLHLDNVKKISDRVFIVVLGGGSNPDQQLPLPSQLTPESLSRLVEGVRLYRQLPGARLLLSGGAVFQDVPEALTLAETAMLLGARKEDIYMESKSLDTGDQAREIAAMIGKAPCILVTSAIHMPRSIALFRKQGLNPVPAPTNYLVMKRTHLHPGIFFPNALSLRKAEAAIHEYLGLLATNWR